jgi:hypothetical protein
MKRNISFILYVFLLLALGACNEDSWLKEEPKSFYVVDNSYVTTAQFDQALNYLYDNLRELNFRNGDQTVTMFMGDIAFAGTDYPDGKFNNFKSWITPDTYIPGVFWDQAYSAIANANVIINRLEQTDQVSDDDKTRIKGEALFFRGYWENFLGNVFGNVPIVTEESTSPKRDYVQNTREEVWVQAAKDLEEAAGLLKNVDEVTDGRINKQAAQDILTEAYISVGRYTDAINTATEVINNPATGLMTQRFGTRASEAGSPYWDLFQYNNQNRSTSGNTESLLVFQYEYKNAGSDYGCDKPRFFEPFYWGMTVLGKNGEDVNGNPDFTYEKGGRGIGVVHPTDHFLYDIWGYDDTMDKYSSTTDDRNSDQLIIRDWKIDNPDAEGYGQWLFRDNWIQDQYRVRHAYPILMKFCRTDNQIPADALNGTTASGERKCNYSWGSIAGNSSMKDEYFIRLADTYLLRAEAYFRNGDAGNALIDINVLRARANATPATEAEIDIDYILDERMRELYFENFRLPTLLRMGKFVERAKKYNPTGYNVYDYQNLWPIPYSEIERNTFGTIIQNPGYPSN